MRPLLAHIYEPHRVTFPCYVQPKLNGIRALYKAGRFQSRDEQPFSIALLKHLAQPLLKIFGSADSSPVLDGELYVHSWPLQRINAAVTPVRQQPTEDTLKVEYHVFDAVDFNRPFIDRVTTTLPFTYQLPTGIRLVDPVYVGTEWEADRQYADFVSLGYEGMMYRLGDCPYTVPKQPWPKGPQDKHYNLHHLTNKFLSDKDNRCWHLLKRKDFYDDEFTITGFNETIGEKGKRGFQLHLLTKNGQPFKAGGGLTHNEIDHYLNHSPIGRQAKIKYLVLSEAGIPTGNPTILAIL